jgi:hypothetical protein
MKCGGGGFQRIWCRGGIDARCQGAPHGHDIHRRRKYRSECYRSARSGGVRASTTARSLLKVERRAPADQPGRPRRSNRSRLRHERARWLRDKPAARTFREGGKLQRRPLDDFDFTQKSNAQLNRFDIAPISGQDSVRLRRPIRPGAGIAATGLTAIISTAADAHPAPRSAKPRPLKRSLKRSTPSVYVPRALICWNGAR